jgi:hypothetical protein
VDRNQTVGQDQRNLSRRRLLRAGGGVAAAAVLGALPLARAGAANADVDPSPRFKLDGAGDYVFLEQPLHNTSWGMQSFAFDNVNRHVYFVQTKPGSVTGDLWVTRTDLYGTELGSMALWGFGHGVQIAVEPYEGEVYLWTEWQSSDRGFGSRIGRFKFADGATLTRTDSRVEDRTPTLANLVTNPQPAIDPYYDRLLVRFRDASGKARVVVFEMSDARAGRLGHDQRKAEWALPDRGTWGDAHPFQGFTGYGQFVYLLEGEGGVSTSYLTSIDLNSGARMHDRFGTTAGASLPHREPEGMAILLDGGPRLAFGFSSGSAPDYRASIFYKSQFV